MPLLGRVGSSLMPTTAMRFALSIRSTAAASRPGAREGTGQDSAGMANSWGGMLSDAFHRRQRILDFRFWILDLRPLKTSYSTRRHGGHGKEVTFVLRALRGSVVIQSLHFGFWIDA